MLRKIVPGLFLILLLMGMLILAFNIKPARGWTGGTVYIRADGSIDPPDAPIITYDYITYTLTGNITSFGNGIVVERDNIIIDGGGYTIRGFYQFIKYDGVVLDYRSNVTVTNMTIINFSWGVRLWASSNINIVENRIFNCIRGIMVGEFSKNNIFDGNNITNNEEGIVCCGPSPSSNNVISRNNLANNRAGILIMGGSSNNVINRNKIENNDLGIRIGLGGHGNDNLIIENNIADNGDGIFIEGSVNITIRNNVIINNIRTGVSLFHTDSSFIIHNLFINCGLYVFNSYNNVVVDNLVNGKPLVYLEGVSDVIISDAGQVILVNCNNITVQNLNLSTSNVGVELFKTNNCIISRNSIISNNYAGILLIFSNKNIISENRFIHCGLHVYESYENMVIDNVVNGKPLVYLENASGATIKDAGQVVLVGCNDIKIVNSNLSNANVGVQLWNTTNTKIFGNNITNNGRGIWCYKSSNNNITENNLVNNVHGVIIQLYSKNNIVSKNNMVNNGFSVVLSMECSNNVIYGNNIVNNYIGVILMQSSSANNICRNNILNNSDCGVWLHSSGGNIIKENNIAYNNVGIEISTSADNLFYHNNFIHNAQQVSAHIGHFNVWDNGYPSGGNYWSDYSGIDANGDGIGDSPYVIIEYYDVDNYPLMGLWTVEGFNVTVAPSVEIIITFENIVSSGITTVSETDVGPEPPSGFKLAGYYYNIKTTANYTGTVKIRIVYDDSSMTVEEENGLRLMQWNEILQQWVDVTTFLDTENNVIYGETSHLSIFAIVMPLYAPPTTYTLTITTTAGGTTNPTPGTYTYSGGFSVQVTAIPSSGYVFDHWELDGINVGSTNPYTVLMDQDHTLKAVFSTQPLSASITPSKAEIKVGESVTFTSTVSGGLPPYSYQWYVNGTAVVGATSQSWTFTPTTPGTYIIHLNVTDSTPQTAKSNAATVTVAPQLMVSISPTSASILVGQSITFTSTVSGGYPPYTYQWYLNNAPVSGATSATWTFTPTTPGIYYVHLKVTDSKGNTAQSEAARITVATVPVGGYSIPIQPSTETEPVAPYIAVLAILTTSLITINRKTKRKNTR